MAADVFVVRARSPARRATDAWRILLFIFASFSRQVPHRKGPFHCFGLLKLSLNHASNLAAMKTKTLIVIGVIGMAVAFAPKARAGFAISITFGTPVVFAPPVVVTPVPPPVCPPPVVVARPPVICAPAPVYIPPPVPVCRPVVHGPPGHAKKYDRWDDDRRGWDRKGHGKHGWGKRDRD